MTNSAATEGPLFLFTTAGGKKKPCKLIGVSSHVDLVAKLREELSDAELTVEDCEVWLEEFEDWVELADVDIGDVPGKRGKMARRKRWWRRRRPRRRPAVLHPPPTPQLETLPTTLFFPLTSVGKVQSRKMV